MEETFYLEKERIPVFIGVKGSQKRLFEKTFDCVIAVDSETGEVQISSENSVNLFIMGNIVLGINLGHSPESTMKLEDETCVIDTIDIKNYVRDINRQKVVLGRIIGKDGSTRKIIEEITKCSVSVKDHIVSVIGTYENTILVHEAIEMLIKGASHKSLYGFLERNSQKIETGLM